MIPAQRSGISISPLTRRERGEKALDLSSCGPLVRLVPVVVLFYSLIRYALLIMPGILPGCRLEYLCRGFSIIYPEESAYIGQAAHLATRRRPAYPSRGIEI